jgi:phage terminase large subunit-like protein
MTWDLSCPDWEARIRAGRSLVPDLPLFLEHADRAAAVFDRLRLPDVQGNPRLADAAGSWFRDVVRALHGALDPATGERQIREVFVLTPKKSAKTTYGAALILTSLLINQRPGALFLLVAPTQDVSEIAFQQASGMVRLDGGLGELLHIQAHLKRITDRHNGARLEILSFDPSVLTGQKPAGVLLDELHVIGGTAKAASAIGQLRGGMVAYPEAFLMFITAVRDGRIGGRLLPVLYEFPPSIASDRAAWSDPANWSMVTPNRGRSITIPRLVEDFTMAQEMGEDEVRRWASQHLNIEIGVGLHSDRWIGSEHWEARAEPGLDLAQIVSRSDVIVVGIDGGGLDDLLGVAVLGRDETTRQWLLWNMAWAHAGVLERRKSEAGRLRDFERAGELIIVDQLPEDLDGLVAMVAEIDDKTGKLAGIALDQAGIGGIIDALAERGIENRSGRPDRIVGISQGYRLMGAIKTVERKLADGTLVHAGQALMSWCCGNAKIELRGNAVMVTKAASGTAKIDPLMATFNAAELMSRSPSAGNPYKDGRGLLILG